MFIQTILLSLLVGIQVFHVSSFNTSPFRISFLSKSISALDAIKSDIVNSNRGMKMMAVAEFDWKSMKKKTDDSMKKSIDALGSSFNTLRAGAANPSVLDRVFVDNYGSLVPLNTIARVGTSGSQQLVIEPFDKALCKEIEKAISQSGLNLTPNNDGAGVIRINIPPLTEERRKELAKQAKTMAEDAKVSVRNNRRDAVDAVKKAEKDKAVDKDSSKKYQDDLQKVTDDYIKKLDELLKKKEKDLLTL